MIAWAPSLDAQVTALLNKLPDASTEIRLRNDSAKSVAAYATSTRWQRQSPANPDLSELVLLFIDPTVYFLKPLNVCLNAAGELPPGEQCAVERLPTSGKPVFEQPVVAAIFTDGSTTGDGALLTQLLSRRSSMLSAVDLAVETLRDAGHTNVPRHQLVRSLKSWRILCAVGTYRLSSVLGRISISRSWENC